MYDRTEVETRAREVVDAAKALGEKENKPERYVNVLMQLFQKPQRIKAVIRRILDDISEETAEIFNDAALAHVFLHRLPDIYVAGKLFHKQTPGNITQIENLPQRLSLSMQKLVEISKQPNISLGTFTTEDMAKVANDLLDKEKMTASGGMEDLLLQVAGLVAMTTDDKMRATPMMPDTLKDLLTVPGLRTLQSRKDIYSVWKGVGEKFEKLDGTRISVNEEYAQSLVGKEFSSYVLKSPSVNFVQIAPPLAARKILSKFIRDDVMEEINEQTLDVTMVPTFDDAGNITGEEAAADYIERETKTEAAAGLMELLRKTPRTKVPGIDPLLYLELRVNKESVGVIAIEEVKEELNKLLTKKTASTKMRVGTVLALRKRIDNYLSKISGKVVELEGEDKRYYFPMLDDAKQVNAFSEMSGSEYAVPMFRIERAELGQLEETESLTVDESVRDILNQPGIITGELIINKIGSIRGDYKSVVRQINDVNKKFFGAAATEARKPSGLAETFNVTGFRRLISGDAPMGDTGRVAASERGYIRGARGGTTEAVRGKMAEMETDGAEAFVELMRDLFFNYIKVGNFFNRDIPEFSKESGYKNIDLILGQQDNPRIRELRSMQVSSAAPALSDFDVTRLNSFFNIFRRGSRLKPASYANMLESAQNAFSDLILLGVPMGVPNRRRQVTELNNQVSNYLATKYKEYLAAYRGDDKPENPVFAGRPLTSYKTLDTSPQLRGAIETLKNIVNDEDLVRYMKETGVKGLPLLQRNVMSLTPEDEDLELSKAYLEAIDFLRSIRGDMIYKASYNTEDLDDMEDIIKSVYETSRVTLYPRDVEIIIESNDSFETISKTHGIPKDVVYQVKGMFRPLRL